MRPLVIVRRLSSVAAKPILIGHFVTPLSWSPLSQFLFFLVAWVLARRQQSFRSRDWEILAKWDCSFTAG